MSSITEQQVEHLAQLSSLILNKEQTAKMQTDLEQILDFVQKIDSAEVGTDLPDERTVSLDDLRRDEPKPSMSNEKALQNAPKTEERYYVVSKVVE